MNLSDLTVLSRQFLRSLKHYSSSKKVLLAAKKLQLVPESRQLFYLWPAAPLSPLTQANALVGGSVKLGQLAQNFPMASQSCRALYRVSSVFCPGEISLLKQARAQKIPIISNQNGVYYQAWYGSGFRLPNKHLSYALQYSDYIIYQSNFCQKAATHFLSPPSVPSRVILNPVDTDLFLPRPITNNSSHLRILTMWGEHERFHRAKAAAAGVAQWQLPREITAELCFLGFNGTKSQHRSDRDFLTKLLAGQEKRKSFTFLPPFSRTEAPALFAAGDIWLHLAHQDPSPNVLGEALASGLVVVYANSGGSPEIVGDCGIPLPSNDSWEVASYPEPELVTAGLHEAQTKLQEYKTRARSRALSLLAVPHFISAHESVLGELRGGK